jgi:cytochrome c oxidase subunit IV
LIALQYFTVGEVRYYGIKTAMLLEIMLLILAVVLLVRIHLERGLSGLKYAIMLPAIPLVLMVGLMTTVGNPLKDLRDLFRDYSNQEKPAFFDHDMSEYARLGSKGDIAHYNSTILHYNPENQKFSAHSQATFWANMMRYDGDKEDFNALLCNSTLYSNLAFGTYTNKEQMALISKVKECAKMAKDMNLRYYIITDKDSAQAIRDTFGDIATLVY